MGNGGLDSLSPFELKNELIRYAKDVSQQKAATHKFLNAGRGNPNWIATTPRESFFLLGQFGLDEARRIRDEPDLAGMPHGDGIAHRLQTFLSQAGGTPAAELLSRSIAYGVDELGFKADPYVLELVDSLIGDNYPEPDRMLVHIEQVVRRFLEKAMFADHPPPGTLDVFATEGGTAAMCYVFKSLKTNLLLRPGDTIALGTPIFTPYVELPHLADFALKTVNIEQSSMSEGRHTWQYPESEIEKLADPKIKAFFVVNPSNPASYGMSEETHERIVDLVKHRRPDLIILTDDVYGTFCEGFRSIAADLPANTILVYSYSKHFGCTGWRLGAVGLNADNIFDRKIAALPESDKLILRKRYAPLSTAPDQIRFIDRLVADSRDVALNHTAGLSTPQQTQMALFSLFHLLDPDDGYQNRCRATVKHRFDRLLAGLGIDLPDDPLRVGYYADFDLEAWGTAVVGPDFMEYVRAHREPIDVVIGLAQQYGTVLLNGSGFDGPAWSVRVSLANLDADAYEAIGRNLRDIVNRAVKRWRQEKGS